MKSNTRFKKNTKGIECLNCKQPITTRDNFCSNCGQVNDTKPLSLKQYITELLGGFFAFDTRTINTLKSLLLKPGKVTKDYIDGKRMQYVNPFQLYLHASIVFFLVTGIFTQIDKYNNLSSKQEETQQKKEIDNDNFMDGLIAGLTHNDKFEAKINNNTIDFVSSKYFSKIISDSLTNKAEKEEKINQLLKNRMKSFYDSISKDTLFNKSRFNKYSKFKKAYFESVSKELDNKNIDIEINKSQNKITTSSPWLKKYTDFYNTKIEDPNVGLDSLGYTKSIKNIYLYNKLQNFKGVFKNEEQANDYGNNIISKLSVALFFMLPIFTIFLSLLYIRNKNNYTEHLIFVFNVQTVFFILLLISNIIDRIFDTDWFSIIFIIGFLFYLYKAMRKFYNQGRFKTIIKFLILNWIYMIISIFGIITVAFLAVLI
jgi:hypothetical protein